MCQLLPVHSLKPVEGDNDDPTVEFYHAKNGRVWRNKMRLLGRSRAHNVATGRAGPRVSTIPNPIAIFKTLISERRAEQSYAAWSNANKHLDGYKARVWYPVTETELYAFFWAPAVQRSLFAKLTTDHRMMGSLQPPHLQSDNVIGALQTAVAVHSVR